MKIRCYYERNGNYYLCMYGDKYVSILMDFKTFNQIEVYAPAYDKYINKGKIIDLIKGDNDESRSYL